MAPPVLRLGAPPLVSAAALSELQCGAYAAAAPAAGRGWSAEAVASAIDDPASLWAEAFAGPGAAAPLIGFALARSVLDEAELLAMARDPAQKGRGLGAMLLEALLSAAQSNGARSMFLEVGVGNAPARALYERFAFEAVGRRVGYYHDGFGRRQDALLMRKWLMAT
ncbi:MAG: GNAT family N-acetyltransferase [Pseudomonadota bacterium]